MSFLGVISSEKSSFSSIAGKMGNRFRSDRIPVRTSKNKVYIPADEPPRKVSFYSISKLWSLWSNAFQMIFCLVKFFKTPNFHVNFLSDTEVPSGHNFCYWCEFSKFSFFFLSKFFYLNVQGVHYLVNVRPWLQAGFEKR